MTLTYNGPAWVLVLLSLLWFVLVFSIWRLRYWEHRLEEAQRESRRLDVEMARLRRGGSR